MGVGRAGFPFGRAALIMHGLALLLLVLMGVWGALLYPTLPDVIPTHWDMSGEPDAFSQRSLGGVFGALFVAAGMALFVLVLHYLVIRLPYQTPTERRAQDLTFGYVNLSLVVLIAWVSYAGWYGLSLGPLFIVFALFAGVPVLIIMGLHLPKIMAERKAMLDPGDPSLDSRYWVLGGMFYSNPRDPRAFVPKAPHMGTGSTMNLATPVGRLVLIALVLVVVGSLALTFLL